MWKGGKPCKQTEASLPFLGPCVLPGKVSPGLQEPGGERVSGSRAFFPHPFFRWSRAPPSRRLIGLGRELVMVRGDPDSQDPGGNIL